jgi:uncharacterized SAM-binding protein YcdF (DUF218 family)
MRLSHAVLYGVRAALSPQVHVFILPLLMVPWLRGWKPKAWITVGRIALSWMVILFLPLGSWGLYHYERLVPASRMDDMKGKTALVLTGNTGLYYLPANQMIWMNNAPRVQEPLRLYRAGVLTRLVISGTRASDINPEIYLDEPVSIARWWREMGVPNEAIAVEAKSLNTHENIAFSKPFLTQGQPAVLITSAFHMPRALATAKKAGMGPLIPYPVDYKVRENLNWWSWENLLNTELLVHELVGFAAYRVLGYSA